LTFLLIWQNLIVVLKYLPSFPFRPKMTQFTYTIPALKKGAIYLRYREIIGFGFKQFASEQDTL